MIFSRPTGQSENGGVPEEKVMGCEPQHCNSINTSSITLNQSIEEMCGADGNCCDLRWLDIRPLKQRAKT